MVFLRGNEFVLNIYFCLCSRWRSTYQEGGWNPTNRLSPSTVFCLSQIRTWISSIICDGLLYVQSSWGWNVKVRFCWYWWNYLPLLFKLFFIAIPCLNTRLFCIYYVRGMALLYPLRCLFFIDLRILITPLVSSNSSCMDSCRYFDIIFLDLNEFLYFLFGTPSISLLRCKD